MPWEVDGAAFRSEMLRLSTQFRSNIGHYKSDAYDEASLRMDFINPFLRALGWDLENANRLPQSLREVQVETRVAVGGRQKRADYLLRTNGIDRFVFEAKSPHVSLGAREAYQTQRYSFNLRLLVAALCNFEHLQLFIVGGKPEKDFPWAACKVWHFTEYVTDAEAIWGLLSREAVGQNSLEQYIDLLPKRALAGNARQGWLIKLERIRTVDTEFLAYFEEQRDLLGHDVLAQNPVFPWTDSILNEVVQRVLDRILLVRICEDRDIDTGRTLEGILGDWEASVEANRASLYSRLIAHFHRLDESFNGALFRRGHESEMISVSDSFLARLIRDLSSEDSPYLFSTLPVDILGAVYERFIERVLHIKGRRVTVELKRDARQKGGIYYTPRYVVNYIVEQTIAPALEGKTVTEVSGLRFLDPSCGSGSFLLRVFERVVEHCVAWFQGHPDEQREQLCYTDANGSLALTTHLKRRLMRSCIYGVDLDPRAVEVTMLSLYLKILEGETRTTLGRQHGLFPTETFLPDLSANIKCGNSLVSSDIVDFVQPSLLGDIAHDNDAFDWSNEFGFQRRPGKFHGIVGNPPYIKIQRLSSTVPEQVEYFKGRYASARRGNYDIYVVFVERARELLRPGGRMGYILPSKFLTTDYGEGLRSLLAEHQAVTGIVDFGHQQIFMGATTYTCLLFVSSVPTTEFTYTLAKPSTNISTGELNFQVLPESTLTAAPWVFATGLGAGIHDKLLAVSAPLLDLPVSISRGSSTGADPIFMLQERRGQLWDRAGNVVEIEPEILRTPIFATDFRRLEFSPDKSNKVIFPYEVRDGHSRIIPFVSFMSKYPKAYAYLLSKKRKLKERKQFTTWYGYSAPRNLVVHEGADLLVPLLANVGSFCRVTGDGSRYCLMAGGGFSITNHSAFSTDALFAILNSRLAFWFLRQISNKFRGGWITCTKQYVGQIPIFDVSKASATQLNLLAELSKSAIKLQAAANSLHEAVGDLSRMRHTRRIEALESRIDAVVYELYGLTDDEIVQIEAELTELTPGRPILEEELDLE
jgi:type I restriction-modification system DNA methylase subunit